MSLSQLDIQKILPERDANSHKGDYGKILLLCGSRGYTGAAALAAMGALRVGAGLVYLCVPESIYEIEAVKLLEPIVLPVSDSNGSFSKEAWLQIEKILPRMDAVLFGPGVGQSEGCDYLLCKLLKEFKNTLIIDADGINLLNGHIDLLRGRTAATILTPHEGEFARLVGHPVSNRQDDAVETAINLSSIIVLKGHKTVITDGEMIYMNSTGNPGMAVGGSGDLLAGMITGLVGQGIPVLDSTVCAVWLHGAAGDICAEELGQYSMLPQDMLDVIPRLMK